MKLSPTQALSDQWTPLELVKSDLTGKTVIVTGANVGLGFEASKHLARMNPGKLIMACRSQEKGDEAVQAVKRDTGCENVECWTLDLADFSSIRAFVARFEELEKGRLDILLENAAVATREFKQTGDGWETTVQVNHLGTAYLALLLLPHLFKTPVTGPSPRIAIVTSATHHWIPRLPVEDSQGRILAKLNDPSYSVPEVMQTRYPASKLLNIFFTRAFAARLGPKSPVVVTTINPGLCHSQLVRNLPWRQYIPLQIYKFVMARTTEMGSRTLIHGSLGGVREDIHGQYLNSHRVEEPSDYVVSEEGKAVEQMLWDETIDILQALDGRIVKITQEYLSESVRV